MKKENWKKYLIGAIIVAIIILLIIWYRNSQKAKQAELAKSKLITGGSTSTSNIGKAAYTKVTDVNVYTYNSAAGILSLAYTKQNINDWVGLIVAERSDTGNTDYFKLTNSAGNSVFVLKSQVSVK